MTQNQVIFTGFGKEKVINNYKINMIFTLYRRASQTIKLGTKR